MKKSNNNIQKYNSDAVSVRIKYKYLKPEQTGKGYACACVCMGIYHEYCANINIKLIYIVSIYTICVVFVYVVCTTCTNQYNKILDYI